MIVRHYKVPIEYPINFVQIKLKVINNDYFISQIKNKINKNLSYRTNVHGKMTDWTSFNEDKNFLNLLNFIDRQYKLNLFDKMELQDSWGIMMEPKDKTVLHNHAANVASGIIYLNDCNNKLIFPQIETEVDVEKNTCVIFSGVLDHYCTEINEGIKFAIAFNLKDVKSWKDYEGTS